MKRRVRKIVNFFAFNLLFFALYLNFIHKDKSLVGAPNMAQQAVPAFSGTVMTEPANQPARNAAAVNTTATQKSQPEEVTTALKLSIN